MSRRRTAGLDQLGPVGSRARNEFAKARDNSFRTKLLRGKNRLHDPIAYLKRVEHWEKKILAGEPVPASVRKMHVRTLLETDRLIRGPVYRRPKKPTLPKLVCLAEVD